MLRQNYPAIINQQIEQFTWLRVARLVANLQKPIFAQRQIAQDVDSATIAVAAASIMILQSGAMTRWLGWLGLAVTALSVVAVVLLAGPLATPLIVIWVVGASVILFRGVGTRVTTSGAVPAVTPAHTPPAVA